jgi:hypothetical protein
MVRLASGQVPDRRRYQNGTSFARVQGFNDVDGGVAGLEHVEELRQGRSVAVEGQACGAGCVEIAGGESAEVVQSVAKCPVGGAPGLAAVRLSPGHPIAVAADLFGAALSGEGVLESLRAGRRDIC